MGKFLRAFSLGCGSVITLGIMLYMAARIFQVSILGYALSSASRVVAILGDHVPILDTQYGKIQIHSTRLNQGQHLTIACADCRLNNQQVSELPFSTSRAILEGDLKQNTFTGEAKIEGITARIQANWSSFVTTGSFWLPETEISQVYQALRTIIPESEHAKITGVVSGQGNFTWPDVYFYFKPRVRNFTVSGLIDKEKYTHGIFQYHGKDEQGQDLIIETGDSNARWVPLANMSPYLPAAIIAVEDRGFYQHPGYDIESILDATLYNKKSGKFKRGGSTLTQQLAKNLFLSEEKTYARKLRELLYAVEIDRELGKKRILELYLNVVEFGPALYGIKDAAQRYFHKSPSEILPEEAAWLASILRSPSHGYLYQYQKQSPDMTRVRNILHLMTGVDTAQIDNALQREVAFQHGNP